MLFNTNFVRAVGVVFAAGVSLHSAAMAQEKGVGAISVTKEVIEVSGNGHQRTFPCNGRKAVVEGSDHVITFTGVCASLDVSGGNNSVTVQLAPQGSLTVAGADHQVRWQSTGEPNQDLSGGKHQIVKLPLK
ncbi:DUF3060 domain-containing protein [Massilia scottii]|uniref:DUF3060 domain-containing protein n=1 Tax=Massilia scottii TaxID=3057166 RepID=UPI0027966487|nr:DUF3060 domain-containing protein [Massilia sp. CCM 9029]MDQ1830250.1 DUF3060 domain-containing protein [Massilia sp. CCM 9029]